MNINKLQYSLVITLLVYTYTTVSSQPSYRMVEFPAGTFTVSMVFTADPNNTNPTISNSRLNIYGNAGSIMIQDSPQTGFAYSVSEFTAGELNGCPDINGETRSLFQMRDGGNVSLGDVSAGGELELFSFIAQNGTVIQYNNGESTCIEEITDNGMNIDPDGVGTNFTSSGIRLEFSSLLPVNLSYFNAAKYENKFSILTWETSSEINNDYFNIERSADGKTFETIGKVLGNGTTSETQNYEFLDREPIAGLNYYRLKQVDFNGEYEYSKVATVDFRNGTEGDIKIFPNPGVNFVNVTLDRAYDAVKITNQLGQLIESLPTSFFSNNQFKLDVSAYSPGVYFLEAKLEQEIVNKQFVKIK